ncbi:MAG: hypothetical protein PHX54_05000 [Lentimicrobiaceae bacterium]|nr:hypothetical protein [Lentimicrobiaceae bacterium]
MGGTSLTPEQEKLNALRQVLPEAFSEGQLDWEKLKATLGEDINFTNERDKDEEGYMTKDGMFKKNSKENGQYHSNWLNMMMPGLYLAKNLLRQDGVKDAKALAEQMKLFVDPVSETATIENMVYELVLKSGKDLNSTIGKNDGYFLINGNEMALILEKVSQEIITEVMSEYPKKVIALDKLFKGNDQLKTNTVLQMKDAGIEFKTI